MIRATLLPAELLASRRSISEGGGRHDYRVVLGHPGRCPLHPTHLSVIFDDSGSVGSPGGNDPIGARFIEAGLAIEAVSRRCRCDRELCSIIHFDVPTSRDVPPTPLRRKGAIARGLSVPMDGAGSSVLGPSLKEAYRLAERLPDHEQMLVVLSDYLLFDDDISHVLDDLCSFPGTVHAVALRAPPPQQLLEDERVRVVSVDYNDAPGTVAHAVFEALTKHRR